MNGSRSNPSRQSDRTSLDALNRTIEGLEARIEGLMGSGREQRPRTATAERDAYAASHAPRAAKAPPEPRPDPLAEIRQRQRALEAGRERPYAREQAPQLREPAPRAAAPVPAPALRAGDDTMTEIAQALVNLRQDLKRDISEGVTREMNALRAELREIKTNAGDGRFADDMRADMGRLAHSITQLTGRSVAPEATGLREDFEELRSLMDGLAREDSLRHMENRWDGFENRLAALDTEGLQEELVSLAYRLDDIKRHIGGMGESPAVRALEDKLISIATAMEHFGNMIQPHDRVMSEQFAAMDMRLDEISRAIAASGRTATANDPGLMQRLENRLSALADQIDLMSHDAANRVNPADELAMRLEALTGRVEEMTKAEATSRLDERLEHLSYLLERTQETAPQPDLTGTLSDISRKIDALENGAVNDVLAQRLDHLARRIDEMAYQQQAPAPAAVVDDSAFLRLEGRLSDIAARLEESTSAAPTDPRALKNLEDQIANLSALMSAPRESAAIPPELDQRMGAIEDYMATSDEYIIEAARQAAEAVVEAYSRHGGPQGVMPAADMSALTALAEDLRHLEDLSRDSEERTHKTFQALHETLVHIADRLDGMEDRGRPLAQMPVADVDFDVDPYALMVAEADVNRTPAAVPAAKASPVIRTAEVAAEAAAPAQAAAMSGTSAIAIEAATRTTEAATAAQAPAKASLLASLGKRLLPGKKAESRATERPMIDPAPSIDPTDVVPTDAANELLEPGSGAPDVKKILERVRASQSAARGKPAGETDRADYIAAARRAAQAAAMEVDANPKQAASKAEKKGATADKAGKASDKTGRTSAFSRYRRPILLAVGAVLLAIMAFPLARTLTSGERAPQPPAEVSALTGAAENPAPALPEATPAQPDAAALGTTAAEAVPPAAEQAQPEATPPVAGEHLTDMVPLDGEGAATLAPPAPSGAAQETSGFVPAPAPQAAITIPDTVQPKSLADAASSGDALALFEIGARYSDGRNGMTVDQKQAASWYQLAADKGFAPAQYRLGSMYEKGNGVERDITKAKAFYEQAANQGNASAMHNLAVLYASGALGQQDYATAASWFTKAANLGITDSQFNLAILCARGNGVPADLEESYKWFAIAAKGGDKDAAQKRDEVAKAMKPDQLERARAKADLWKPEPVDHRTNAIDIPDEWAGTGAKTASVDMKKAVRNIQAILNNNGFDAGVPDGEMGAKTVTAIKNFQKSVGQEPDGRVTDATVKALLERNKQAGKAI
ncbi:peptidoglycan-binding protein [Rhizobium leguminosarum]|uniref:peptidoglycan-binding protein n=1 Tax=Rhizobium leguminosarum TaxID=384 RepID=UPI0015DB79F6|nr:peptidoglycan-binding protein [Rhizobium leguminosarum]NZD49134.1 SEL1-like repeat protein [Rhizobium leguminosarum]